MPFHLFPVAKNSFIIFDEKGRIYNHEPKNKKECAMQIKEIGKGLTMSKAYQKSWIIPTRVQVCEVENIIPSRFLNFASKHKLLREAPNPMLEGSFKIGHSPPQVYLQRDVEHAKKLKMFQLPYRIILKSDMGEIGMIALEDKDVFEKYCEELIQTTANPSSPVVSTYEIEQHPV